MAQRADCNKGDTFAEADTFILIHQTDRPHQSLLHTRLNNVVLLIGMY